MLWKNGSRTIRLGQFGATIRLGQFGAKYDINFIESSAFVLFINPASISARFSSSIPLLFQQYFFINPASIFFSAIFFSPIPFGTRHYELGLLIDEKNIATLIKNIAEMEAH